MIQLLVQIIKRLFPLLILFAHVLQFFSGVRHDNHGYADFPGKFGQLFVTFFDLLVERLVLDF